MLTSRDAQRLAAAPAARAPARGRWRAAFAPALLALALASPAAARAAALAGRIVEADGARAVEGALVRLLETGATRRTDAHGRFVFAGLRPGTWTVSAHHLAFADVERAVRLSGDGADTLVLEVQPALHRTDEVLVRSTRLFASLRASPGASEAWNASRLRQGPAATVPEALATLPGVALARDGAWATAVSIRGMGRSSVVALVDHARLETATDLAGGLSLVDPAEVERVEVMKSPGSVLFGSGAFGGAVHVVTRRPGFRDDAAWSAEWTEGVTGADRGVAHHLALEQASSRHALRLSAGARGADDVRTPEGRLPGSRWSDWTGNAALALRAASGPSALVSWQRAQAEDTGIPGGKPIAAAAVARYTLARRERFAAELQVPNAWGAVPLVTVRASRQDITRQVEIVQGPSVVVTPHAVHATTSGALEARIRPGRDQVLLVGAEAWRRSLDSRRERRLAASGQVLGERPVPPASFLSAGAYAQHEWEAAPGRVRVVTGARWDRGRTRNEVALQPEYVLQDGVPQQPVPGQFLLWPARTTRDDSWSASAGAHVTLSPAWSVSALCATAYRSPSLEERFQFLDLGSSVQLGNPALAPERSLALDLGTRFEAGGTRLRADLFGNRLTRLVAEEAGTWEGRPAWIRTNLGAARLYGFEVAFEQDLGRHAVLRASAAQARGEDTGRRVNLSQVAPLSGTAEVGVRAAGAGTLRLACTAARAQRHPGPDEAPTPGWTAWSAGFASRDVRAAGATCRLRAGVENLFDRPYRLHLSTLRGVLKLEPGRSAYAMLTLGFGGDPT